METPEQSGSTQNVTAENEAAAEKKERTPREPQPYLVLCQDKDATGDNARTWHAVGEVSARSVNGAISDAAGSMGEAAANYRYLAIRSAKPKTISQRTQVV